MDNLKERKQLRLRLSLLLVCTLIVSTPANAFMGIIYGWAMDKINESWTPVNVADQQRKAIDHSTVGLMNMDTPSASIVLSKKEVTPLIINAIEIANASLPAKVTNVGISFSEQSIQFSGNFSGRWEEKGVDASGKVAGDVTFSLDDKKLVLSPSFRSVKVEKLEVDDWWWLPNKIALLVTPLLETFIENINGQIKPESIDLLSELTQKQEIIDLGGQTITIPKLAIKAASMLVNQEHIGILLEFDSKPSSKAKELEHQFDYSEFENKFLVKAGNLISSPPTTGINFNQNFVSTLFGELALFESEQERQQLIISKTIENLNQIRGPDFVLRISSSKVDNLILEQLKKSVQEMDEPHVTVKSIKHKFNFGALEMIAEIDGKFEVGANDFATVQLLVAIQIGTYVDNSGKSLNLLPSVSGFSIESLSLKDGSVDFNRITVSMNALLTRIRDSINRIVPEIPITIPAVLPQKHELTPVKFAGGEASFSPRFFTPPKYELERGIFYFSEQGLWVLADIGIPELPERQSAGNISLPNGNLTSKELDEEILALIEKKIGALSDEDIYAFSSWKRFAEMFNLTWKILSPTVALSIDSGKQKMENQEINLLEHSRLECKRDRDCSPDYSHCKAGRDTRDCSQPHDTRNCSACLLRAPRICAFGGCTGGQCVQRGNDPICEAAKAAQNAIYATNRTSCEAAKEAQNVAYRIAREACVTKEKAAILDCNRLAEQEVAECHLSKLFQNFGAEISGVGNIGGDAQLSGNLKIDASRLNFNPDKLQVQFSPHVSGNLRADIGLDWTPYDLIGHAFCPTRGRVNADSTATFNDARPSLKATLLKEGQAEDDGDPDTVDLGIQFSKTRFPVTIRPGLLHSLYQRNPQIIVTCPVSNLLIIPALAFNGTNKAIGENDIARAVASVSNPGLIAYSALHDAEPETMSTLFGGSFYIEIEERIQPLPVSITTINLPGGEVTFRPSLHEKGFLLSATVN
jgi:hypothetical protein